MSNSRFLLFPLLALSLITDLPAQDSGSTPLATPSATPSAAPSMTPPVAEAVSSTAPSAAPTTAPAPVVEPASAVPAPAAAPSPASAASSPTAPISANYFVAPGGSDTAAGSVDQPFATISRAYEAASAGQTICLRGGTYREGVELKSKSGTEGAPITLRAYPGEKPVISGLDLLDLKWNATATPGLYEADFQIAPFAQLFYDGKPLLEARWPHCPRDTNGDWNFFSPDAWSTVDPEGNGDGTIKDKHLAESGLDMTGAGAVLNVAHQYYSWSRTVQNHAKGKDTFNYPQDLGVKKTADEGGVNSQYNRNRYYLFGLREFLGAPGEWFLDQANHKLLLMTPDGKAPVAGKLEVKRRDWGFIADQNSSYLTLDGVTFFGTAFRFGKDYNSRSIGIVINDCSILYSSWSTWVRVPKGAPHSGEDRIYPTINADKSRVTDNLFAYGALSALYIMGWQNLIENNVFHDFDYDSSLDYPPLQVNKPWPVLEDKGGYDIVRGNSIYRSGGILVQVALHGNEVCYNDLHDTFLSCYGGNKDVSALYTQAPLCSGTRFHHNWVHDGYAGTPPHPWGGGMGIRGDDKTCGLTIDHNVVWNLGSAGVELKNVDQPTPEQANVFANNTVFNHSKYNEKKNAVVFETEHGAENSLSTAVNNLTDGIYGHWFNKPLGTIKLFTNNTTSFDPSTQLRNAAWYDFRPSASATNLLHGGIEVPGISTNGPSGAPGIGAYDATEEGYWIPGHRAPEASCLIPPDRVQGAPANTDLIWLAGRGAASGDVYLGTSADAVGAATKTSPEFKGNHVPNLLAPGALAAGTTYYWRVDSVGKDGSVVKGPVWSFTTK